MHGGASRWIPAKTGDAPREGRVMSPTDDRSRSDYGRANGWDTDYPALGPGDGPGYAGPVAYCGRPVITDPAALRRRAPDVAIIGIPFDDRVSYRPGARFGPRAIRQATSTGGGHSLALGVEPFRVLDVVDAGDADIVPGMARAWSRGRLPPGAGGHVQRRGAHHPRRGPFHHVAGGQRRRPDGRAPTGGHDPFRRPRRYRR